MVMVLILSMKIRKGFCCLDVGRMQGANLKMRKKKMDPGRGMPLGQISLLYKVETMADEQNLDDRQRAELRQRLAYPILRTFEKWMESYYPKVLPKGRMEKALKYTYSIYRRLARYHL